MPLEGRILRDAQGQVIFIGDCAPLSFLQTVRHLIAAEVDAEVFPAAHRDSIIEVARPVSADRYRQPSLVVTPHEVQSFLEQYFVVTQGLVDLFPYDELLAKMMSWASDHSPQSAESVVFLLVLAIGAQETHEVKAEAWFRHARDMLVKHMCNSMSIRTVQGFTLVAVFMLRAFQPNGAYLYFSLAARTAYAIGIHRTEVNASFGDSAKVLRDRVWKSLRVVDLIISSILGRPPSTSDVDCTVRYNAPPESTEQFTTSILDASVQIFMIIERVVVEVYSRKRISLRIAKYVSRQLKAWASNWLNPLADTISRPPHASATRGAVVGACSTICSYYYGIMLLTRPFLIYELYEYMGASLKGGGTQVEHLEKRKYADAALDAAASFVDTLQGVIKANHMPQKMPLIVSWLFPTSLVLAVSLLGRCGQAFRPDCEASIHCLDYFAKVDPHARQYSMIARSLLKATTAHVKKRELHLRAEQKQASSQLFGLLPSTAGADGATRHAVSQPQDSITIQHAESEIPGTAPGNQHADTSTTPSDWTIYDADFFALPWSHENDQGLQDFLQPGTYNLDGATVADIPLFPMYDQHTGAAFV